VAVAVVEIELTPPRILAELAVVAMGLLEIIAFLRLLPQLLEPSTLEAVEVAVVVLVVLAW
jgi:hypothetical protein